MHLSDTSTDPRLDETLQLIGSDKVEGTEVRRPDGAHLGTIRRVMIDKITGKVAYVVMSFGGFLGVGEDFYPVPWDRLKYNEMLDAYELDISDDQLSGAPKFTDEAVYDFSRAEGRRVNDFYGVPTSF
ncbi:PRC-barrel domain-containing protein [Beijerinckia sp. L45]|uniref:PRC-barrel domain-containing protein n=1 Tax=Beijerinckia sp. L45 TaxID=1641855 RepID=UPI00131C03E0|nr:PRC-barrel domain-containing protein [Beijerinckia sp. L45]